MYNQITIIGAGAWGTALAQAFAARTKKVILIANNPLVIKEINEQHTNCLYLKTRRLANNIIAFDKLTELNKSQIIIIATPTFAVREICQLIKQQQIANNIPIIIASKGLEPNSLLMMSEVAEQLLINFSILVIAGPNFADEIADNQPAGATIAGNDYQLTQVIAKLLSSNNFILNPSDDLIGTQIYSVAKNALAIACGVITHQFGENCKALLITKSLIEINKLSLAVGGKFETILSLAGIGDIILTCNSSKSRNNKLGIELAKGRSTDDILAKEQITAEGVNSSKAIMELINKIKLDLPIFKKIYQIIHQQAPVESLINQLTKNQ